MRQVAFYWFKTDSLRNDIMLLICPVHLSKQLLLPVSYLCCPLSSLSVSADSVTEAIGQRSQACVMAEEGFITQGNLANVPWANLSGRTPANRSYVTPEGNYN